MIIPGRIALQRSVITRMRSTTQQSSGALIDFDNKHRKTAQNAEIPFQSPLRSENVASTAVSPDPELSALTGTLSSVDYIDLDLGSYPVKFKETVNMPLDLMGQILVRSSLFHSGALFHAGIMDRG
ncbi:hypothetical protein NX059_001672 [Plenodomus lindquistii]|nr:hypothetical protein NX059_001672 [Plenodomus lindquistii]